MKTLTIQVPDVAVRLLRGRLATDGVRATPARVRGAVARAACTQILTLATLPVGLGTMPELEAILVAIERDPAVRRRIECIGREVLRPAVVAAARGAGRDAVRAGTRALAAPVAKRATAARGRRRAKSAR